MSENGCKAWLLPVATDMNVAIGEFEMIHIISEHLHFHTIPHSPMYCNKILYWQEQPLPVFDIHYYIKYQGGQNQENGGACNFVCVVAYASDQQEKIIQYGAISLNALPFKIDVTDDLACGYPHGEQSWGNIARSCFRYAEHGSTPIVDLQKIYCTEPAAY